MRVLHIVTRLHVAGSERVAETLASGIVAHGESAAVAPVAGPLDHELAAQLRARLRAAGVAVLETTGEPGVKRASLQAPLHLGRVVDEFEPDVVHLHTEIPEFAWALTTVVSRRAARLPVVRTIHNTVLWGGWRLAGLFAEARLGNAHVIAVSGGARDAFVVRQWKIARRRRAVDVIYNGIACPASTEPARSVPATPILCYAGRLELQKGIDVLLDALALLDRSDVAFDVVIHGTGRLEGRVAAALTGLRRRVELLPPRLDLVAQLPTFDAILMPSRFEGLPLLAVESLCAGVPVLATSAPGLDEAVPDWYPGRCTVGDAAAFAAMIVEFVRDADRWSAETEAARSWARHRFAPEAMIGRYLDVYRGVGGMGRATQGIVPPGQGS